MHGFKLGLAGWCAALLITACADDARSSDTEGDGTAGDTTGTMTVGMTMTAGEASSSGEPPGDGSTTEEPDGTGPGTTETGDHDGSSSGEASESSGEESRSTDGGSTDGGSTDGGSTDEGTTGDPLGDCVDFELGMAVGNDVHAGSTVGQGDDFDWSECFGEKGRDEPGDDYVIHWTAPGEGEYVISLDGSAYDTLLHVATPLCGGEILECNDDCFDLQSGVSILLGEGQDIFIVIDGYAGDGGNYVLNILPDIGLECDFGGSTGFSDTG